MSEAMVTRFHRTTMEPGAAADPGPQPDGDQPVVDPAPRRFPWAGLGAILLGLVVVAPILWAGINGLVRTWYPAGDWAMIELRTLDVGTGHTPLVGPYSRYRWNHPGPLLVWLLAVPYRLTGGNPSALLFGAALINASAVGGALWLAWRRARLALVAPMAFAFALLIHSFGPLLVRNPWNAWIIVLPLGLLVVATWSAVDGDRLGWPAVAAVGAFLGQTHIGLLPFVAVASIAAVGAVWWRRRTVRALVPGLVVLAICWSPVVFDLLFGSRNLLAVADHFRGGTTPVGWGTGFGIAARELTAPAPWLGGPEEVNTAGGGMKLGEVALLTVPLVLFGATLLAAALARAWTAFRFQVVVAVTALLGVFAVSRITDDVFDYLVRWWWTIAALAATAMLFSAICVVRTAFDAAAVRGSSRSRTAVRFAASVAVLVVALVVVARPSIDSAEAVGAGALPVDDWFPAMDRITPQTLGALDHGRPVLLRSVGPISGWAADALAPRLAADGYDVRIDDFGVNRFKVGDARMAPPDDAGLAPMQGVWVVSGYRIHDFQASGTGRQVAAFDPLSPGERTEYDQLEARLRSAYLAAGRDDLAKLLDEGLSLFSDRPVPGLDPADQARYEELRRRGVEVGVFVTDHGDQPPPGEHLP